MSVLFPLVNSDRGMVSEAVQLHELDNVATVRSVQTEQPGLCGVSGASMRTVPLPVPIPLGHDIAVASISEDAVITRYGQAVGIATEDIPIGGHVNVHNTIGMADAGPASVGPRGASLGSIARTVGRARSRTRTYAQGHRQEKV